METKELPECPSSGPTLCPLGDYDLYIQELEDRIAALEAERDLIAKYLYKDPPFDDCAGICLHTKASEYAGEIQEAGPMDYYKAFLDCCRAALLPGRGE